MCSAVGTRVFTEFAQKESVEKRQLIEAVIQRDIADGFVGVTQRMANGLQSHLIAKGGEGLAGVEKKLSGKSRTTHSGQLEEVIQADLIPMMG